MANNEPFAMVSHKTVATIKTCHVGELPDFPSVSAADCVGYTPPNTRIISLAFVTAYIYQSFVMVNDTVMSIECTWKTLWLWHILGLYSKSPLAVKQLSRQMLDVHADSERKTEELRKFEADVVAKLDLLVQKNKVAQSSLDEVKSELVIARSQVASLEAQSLTVVATHTQEAVDEAVHI
ncbi:hypothetical protein H6P81_012348 [Aristolochia fimbriata]|uniref:Uncharacterized protein n=1 Tax=Aristolochia fimbriata TaxID=158543 RepID=A0AAV7EBJ4_ARIFI|nr:hypothetical protein H6P81_012348 [Aristolochia fimbriata]